MVEARFCPYCGKPVAANDATFCQYCGKPLAGGSPLEPVAYSSGASAPFAQAPVRVASPSVPVSPYLAGATPPWTQPPMSPYGTAQPPQMIVTASPKSPGIAVLLELLIPGGGAMYADRVGVGVGWLIATVAASIASWIAAAALTQNAVNQSYYSYYGDSYYSSSPDYSSVYAVLAVAAAVGLTWLVVRCVLASGYVRAYNMRLAGATAGGGATLTNFVAGGASSPSPINLVRAWVVTIVFALLVLFAAYFTWYGIWIVLLAPVSFWIGLIRLANTNWLRAAGEILLVNAVGFVLLFVVERAVEADRYYFYYDYFLYYSNDVIVAAIIAAVLSFLAALLFTNWSVVRPLASGKLLMRRLPFALGTLAALIVLTYVVGYVSSYVGLLAAPVIAIIAASSTLRQVRMGTVGTASPTLPPPPPTSPPPPPSYPTYPEAISPQ